MKRALIALALVVVLGLAGGIYYTLQSLDGIVKRAIESYGSQITGTSVSVGSVSISLQEGRGTLSGLQIANPPGFASGDAFSLGQITVQIDPASLTSQPIVLKEVVVESPRVEYLVDAKGRRNIDTILENVKRYQAAGAQSGGSGSEGPEVRLRIDRFSFERGEIKADASALQSGRSFDVKLPSLQLAQVGGPGGAPPGVVGKEILDAYTQKVVVTVAASQGQKQLEKVLDKKLGKGAGKAVGGLIGDVLRGAEK